MLSELAEKLNSILQVEPFNGVSVEFICPKLFRSNVYYKIFFTVSALIADRLVIAKLFIKTFDFFPALQKNIL